MRVFWLLPAEVRKAIQYSNNNPRNDWYNQKKIGAHDARVDLAEAIQNLPNGDAFLQEMELVQFPNPDWLDNVLFYLGLDCEAHMVGGYPARAFILANLAKMICKDHEQKLDDFNKNEAARREQAKLYELNRRDGTAPPAKTDAQKNMEFQQLRQRLHGYHHVSKKRARDGNSAGSSKKPKK